MTEWQKYEKAIKRTQKASRRTPINLDELKWTNDRKTERQLKRPPSELQWTKMNWYELKMNYWSRWSVDLTSVPYSSPDDLIQLCLGITQMKLSTKQFLMLAPQFSTECRAHINRGQDLWDNDWQVMKNCTVDDNKLEVIRKIPFPGVVTGLTKMPRQFGDPFIRCYFFYFSKIYNICMNKGTDMFPEKYPL